MLGIALRWTSIPSGGGGELKTLQVASRYRNQDKHRPDGPLASYADFTCLQSVRTILNRIVCETC